ncbi:fumarylacetoacetate hydrolase family protein [Dactylosporangium sp. CA-092794]|uniref:fumarylacetoacetate hydrolase family protein n=1 Tax=Dactylosporangium sp. CA-092794 TaxID=3239929 RepID=UPI003D8E474C
MRFGTVRSNGRERVVAALDEQHGLLLEGVPSLAQIIADWPAAEPVVKQALATDRAGARHVDQFDWLPPIPRPGKVICVALNNSANTDRIMSGPKHPAMFLKPASSLIGHGQSIRLRADYGRVHPEPELAVVIGRGGVDISHDTALDHVFGYTIMNDLTSPTMRGEDTFHYRAIHPASDGSSGLSYVDTWVTYPMRYKGSDTFGPIGPWVATTDEIPDPHDLTIQCVHQGRVVTADNTANLLHSVADVIAFVSRYTALETADIIAMGTALKASAAGGSAVQNVDLTALGGPIDVSISGIGTLSNPVEMR